MSDLTIKVFETLNNISINDSILININLPEKCPYCELTQSPKYINTSGIERSNRKFSIILECNKCKQHFIQSYEMNNTTSHRLGRVVSIADRINPVYEYDNDDLSSEIISCSSDFIKIHSQLKKAEKHNLEDLLKLGYRKAIEQLVWDYLINFEGKNANSLQKKSFPDRIKLLNLPESDWLSDLISWVGNDGAHPYQRHEDLSNEDMKILSNMLISNIQTLIQQHNYRNYHSKNK
ncbi:hypothetical protein [Mammaliicoccus sciuri]|uniref:hypothetical protein n=1 Tax=Mammaliicoccus sciuri TaxID=1296 RepID=UPI001FB447E4|nr:hypothetical protein [Mammaliicoccus sciuri]MCJ0918688.1 hypothetical protein [Mammaliicoccus sciuri]MCJ0961292.1 hypothetical protein [Mammaliicoccus sciuri]